MESCQIEKLSVIINQINSISDKQANLVITRDNRIVTEQNLIAENDMLYINGFPATEMQPIAERKTKLHDRLIELHIEIEDLTAESINLALKEYLCNLYFQQGVPLDYINSIHTEYNEDDFIFFINLLESKLEADSNIQQEVLVHNNSYRPSQQYNETAIVQANEFTAQQHSIAYKPNSSQEIFLAIKHERGSRYKINYRYDMMSAKYLEQHANEKYLSVDGWKHKLANFFLKTLGYRDNDLEIPEISMSSYYNQKTFYTTKQEAEEALNSIQDALIKQGLDRFSNAHILNINKIKDRSTKNYSIFRSYRKTIKKGKETDRELIQATKNLLKHKKILSLADGYSKKQTSKALLANLEAIATPISITAADKSNPPRKKIYSDENNKNITIEQIQLNNQKSFLRQRLQDKFDLVVSHKVLCHCKRESFDSGSCGGVLMYEPEGLKLFLLRIASVLDTTNKDAKAILTGTNAREFEFWKQDIQEFNEENRGELTAEIARNSSGVFKGIIIYNC